ncbi:MAG: response regulator, partial [Myxococcota bacterium]
MSSSPIILLVEDNPADAELLEMALEETGIITAEEPLRVVTDGQQAVDFLFQRGAYKGSPRPDFILLDLNLPKMDGREVLAEIKASDDLKIIPVAVLTSSQAEEDVLRAYRLYANCYLRK